MKSSSVFCQSFPKFLLVLLFVASATILSAQAKLSIQGILKKSDGTALTDGTYQLKFRIYNVETGGAAIWTETQTDIEVIGGIYSAVLGSTTPLNIPFTEPYFVSVAVGTGLEMVPRIPLTSAPYALSLIGEDNKFPSSGNVGIGTATPTDKLHVKNTTPINGSAKILLEGPANGVTELYIKKTDVTGAFFGYNQPAAGNVFRIGHNNGSMQLLASGTGNNIKLTADNGVNIEGQATITKGVLARGGRPGAFGVNQNGYAFSGNGGDVDSGLFSTADGVVSLYANDEEILQVKTDAVRIPRALYARGGEPGAEGEYRNGYAFEGNSGDNDSGLFSIGTNSASLFADAREKVRVTYDDVYLYNIPVNAGGNGLRISGDRVTRDASSARYKDNIQPLALDFHRILLAEPRQYNYKTTPERLDIGFIAEELDALGFRELVVYDKDGRPDGVLYDRMVVYLMPLLREQQQRVEALEQNNAANTSTVSSLQAENAALRQMLNDLRADVNALKASADAGLNGERK